MCVRTHLFRASPLVFTFPLSLLVSLQTRILVTHGISFLPQVDNIMVLVDGRVSEMGSYQALLKENGAFAEFLRNYSLEDIIEEEEATGVCEGAVVCVCVCLGVSCVCGG